MALPAQGVSHRGARYHRRDGVPGRRAAPSATARFEDRRAATAAPMSAAPQPHQAGDRRAARQRVAAARARIHARARCGGAEAPTRPQRHPAAPPRTSRTPPTPCRRASAPAGTGARARHPGQGARIFEACNFQDLTGQRIAKVLTHAEIRRGAHRADDRDLGRHRRLQEPVAAAADRNERRRCCTARSSTATTATCRRTTSTRCSTDASTTVAPSADAGSPKTDERHQRKAPRPARARPDRTRVRRRRRAPAARSPASPAHGRRSARSVRRSRPAPNSASGTAPRAMVIRPLRDAEHHRERRRRPAPTCRTAPAARRPAAACRRRSARPCSGWTLRANDELADAAPATCDGPNSVPIVTTVAASMPARPKIASRCADSPDGTKA